jgi:hypothetical protein
MEQLVKDVRTTNRVTKPKARNARKRKGRKYESKAIVKRGKKPIEKPPSVSAFKKFVSNTQFRVHKTGQPPQLVDVTAQNYIVSND